MRQGPAACGGCVPPAAQAWGGGGAHKHLGVDRGWTNPGAAEGRVGRGLAMVGVGVLNLGSHSAGQVALKQGQDPGLR